METTSILTIQMVMMMLGALFLVSGAIRIGVLALKMPKSEFRTVLRMLTVALLFLAAIVGGFAFPIAFSFSELGFSSAVEIALGLLGAVAILLVILSLVKLMKFMGGGEE